MRLSKMTLRNYRKYQDVSIDFPDGLIGIIGPNGAGKSTLLEAVAWALYGNPAARTSKEEIKRQGAKLKDICEVTLEMELGGTNYQIIREIRGKDSSSDAAIYVPDGKDGGKKCTARGSRDTLKYVNRMLGMDREAFFTSFFAKQKELNALSDLKPAERKSLIIRMLEIDNIDKAIEHLRTDLRELTAHIDILRTTQKDKTALKNVMSGKQKELTQKKSELDAKQKIQKELELKQNKSKETFTKEEEKREKHQNLANQYRLTNERLVDTKANFDQLKKEQKQVSTLKNQLDKEKVSLAEYEKVKQEVVFYDQLAAQVKLVNELERQKNQTQNKIRQNNEALTTLKQQKTAFAETQSQIQKISQSLEQTQTQSQKISQRKGELLAKQSMTREAIQKLVSQNANIEKLGPKSSCPTCSRPLGEDFEKITAHFESEIKESKQELAKNDLKIDEAKQSEKQVKESIAALDKELETLTEKQNKLNLTKQKSELISKEQTRYQTEIKNIENRLKQIKAKPYDQTEHAKLTKRLEQLTKKRDEILKIKTQTERLPELKTKIESTKQKKALLEQKLNAVEKEGKKLEFTEELYQKAKKDYEQAQKEYHSQELITQQTKHEIEMLEVSLSNIQQEINQYQEQKKEIDKLTKEKQARDHLQTVLAEFRKHLIGRIRPVLSQKASNYFRDLTDGKYQQIELNEDYETYVYDNGEKFLIERFSGGEKDLANLCLRLAISELMAEVSGSEFGFIVLDEILGSQDPFRKSHIMHGLAKLSYLFRQIFLITHVEDVKDLMEHVVTITEDESGISHLTLS